MGFRKIFWGLIFLFDFRLGGFDILPDFIGYIFMYQGLTILMDINIYFEQAKKYTLPMFFISLFDIYQVTAPINDIGVTEISFFSVVIGLIATIINLIIIYNICVGIQKEASVVHDTDLELKAAFRFKLYLIVNIIVIVGMVLPVLLAYLFVFVLIFSTVTYFLMLGLMLQASTQLE